MNKNGYITPSGFADMMTKGTKGEEFGKTALAYAGRIALERLGVDIPDIKGAALDHGIEWEQHAIQEYEASANVMVLCDLSQMVHPTVQYIAGTPDGLVGEDGIIEVKCPFNPLNHLANIRTGEQIMDYRWQIQGYLWITDRKWCDFMSFDPRFPEHLRLSVHRVDRSEPMIQELAERAAKFESIVKSIVGGLQNA